MGISTLILGESGSGKSTSMRNLDPGEVILVQVVKKPLPFRSTEWKPRNKETQQGSIITTDNPDTICTIIKMAATRGKSIVVIDDFQYVMANEFMRRSQEKGFDKFTEIARHAWDIINSVSEAAPDTRVYFLSHTQTDDFGHVKAKTIGKMLDDKIVVEGMFTIVLRSLVRDGRHTFSTKNSGSDTVKAPLGMFEEPEIDNDLNAVDSTICEYYSINQKQQKENAA